MNRRDFIANAAVVTAGFSILPAYACKASRLLTEQGVYPVLYPTSNGYTQEELPYAFEALEPFIDTETMKIHFGKHHTAYITNLNKVYNGQKDIVGKPLHEVLAVVGTLDKSIQTTVRNNGGGHWNHTFFWNILTPEKNTKPSANLEKAITQAFGNMDEFKKKFKEKALSQFGSGWAWLITDEHKHLKIVSTPNQDNPLMDVSAEKGIPVLGVDVWEHAYYLKYQNKRADYLDQIWNVINWNKVSDIYEKA